MCLHRKVGNIMKEVEVWAVAVVIGIVISVAAVMARGNYNNQKSNFPVAFASDIVVGTVNVATMTVCSRGSQQVVLSTSQINGCRSFRPHSIRND